MTVHHSANTDPGTSASGPAADTTQEVSVRNAAFGSVVHHQAGINPATAETVLGTLRTATGIPVHANAAKDTDRITYRGAEMTVGNATRMGILVKAHTGGLVEGAAPVHTPAQSPAPAPAVDPATTVQIDHLAASIHADIRSKVPATTFASAIANIKKTGAVSRGNLTAMASSLGVTPQEASNQLIVLGHAFDRQAQTALSRLGIEAEDMKGFDDFMEQRHPQKMQEIAAKQMRGDLSGYREAAQLYFQRLDQIDPSRILDADFGDSGITAQRIGKVIVLNVPGKGQISYAAAVRAGLVKLS